MKTQRREKKGRAKGIGNEALRSLENPKYWAKLDAEMAEVDEERAAKRKDAILHLRINSRDLTKLKEKALRAGVRYQTFVARILHLAAQNTGRHG